MFSDTYYDEFLTALTERVEVRHRSGMPIPDAYLRAMTDDRVLAELMHPEVAKSIEEHGYHRGRLASAKVVRPHLEGLFPDRIADCERASLAFDTLFQDVQMQLAQGSKAS